MTHLPAIPVEARPGSSLEAPAALAVVALCLVLSMAPWFSATAVLPQLRVEWNLSASTSALLTISVQIGFVLGALASALAPQIGRVLPRGFPALRRRNLLDDAIDEARRGSIAPRSWYNAIPEQPGEREAASEADAEATATPRPETAPSTPEAAEPDRPRYTVHPGQQGKHQPGHNNHKPERGRSDMAPDVNAQELVDRFAHRGESANGIPPGTPGAIERFDAGDRIIGVYRDSAGRSAPTTRGIIHYGSNGSVHVRPAAPRGWTGGSGK